jgi:Predicted ATPase of the ABC class
MARDGRMRALVMDESITPLLYRVNGMYISHRISSVVVVGGVGDWLDVPHNVILLDKYVASDATKKAQSISYQFSYGHVQYGGRGVVHRLEWERTGTPFLRRPTDSFSKRYDTDVVVSLLDGGHAVSLHKEGDGKEPDEDNDNISMVDDDEDGCIDASRLEQLLGRRQLYGCGLCVAWLLQFAPEHPQLGIKDLLHSLDETLDTGGMQKILMDLSETSKNGSAFKTRSWAHLMEWVGFVERPRRFEIGQALARFHGIQMEEIPVEDDGTDEAERLKEEKRKQALAELWAKRRAPSS